MTQSPAMAMHGAGAGDGGGGVSARLVVEPHVRMWGLTDRLEQGRECGAVGSSISGTLPEHGQPGRISCRVNVSVTKSDAKDRWKLEDAGGGTWRLVNSGGGANGECLNPWLLTDSSGRAKIGTVGCNHTRAGIEWRIVFANTGSDTFYLRSISDQGCAESVDGGAVIDKCDGTKRPQQFKLST